MLRIEERNIFIHRGDDGECLTFKIPLTFNDDGSVKEFYKFLKDDEVRLSIYKRGSNYQEPLTEIDKLINEETEEIIFELREKDTNLGNPSNKNLIFEYEITLNNNVSIGFDEHKGPCYYTILPSKGVDVNE